MSASFPAVLVREVASESARLSALGFSRETIADAAEFATRRVAVFGGSVSLLTFTVRAEDGREFDCRAEVTGSGPNRCARLLDDGDTQAAIALLGEDEVLAVAHDALWARDGFHEEPAR